MTSMKAITTFLSRKRIAVIGVSQQSQDFSRALFREFLGRDYDAVPVNPAAQDIEGRRCFARVQDISPPVDAALLMTSPAVTDTVVRDCAAAGIRQVWMYRGVGRGAVSAEAVKFCESQGMSVISGECPYMFLPGAAWVHRIHGLVRKLSGAYPGVTVDVG
jgi:predicted CoA-binding protein